MDTTVLVLIIVAVVLLAAVVAMGFMLSQRKRSEQLQEKFGPEYERRVAETGDRKQAESDLRARQERRNKLDVRDLKPQERAQFQQNWDNVQRGFVDDPTRALHDADRLVVTVMKVRGYPVDDFDRRADDISVDHPAVVRHYRDAHQVRNASADGRMDTEQQRHALTSYRSLVEALLGSSDTHSSPNSHTTNGHERRADDRIDDRIDDRSNGDHRPEPANGARHAYDHESDIHENTERTR